MEYLLFVVCLTAAVTDILWRRIPNFWLESWFLTGLLLAGLELLPISEMTVSLSELTCRSFGVWSVKAAVGYLSRAGAVVLLLNFARRLRMIGAGDVKLCSVMAAFLRPRAFACCAFYSLFLGSIASFFYMVFTHSFRQRIGVFLTWFSRCVSSGQWIPYRKEQNMDGTIPFAPLLLAGYLLWWRGI